MKKFNVSILALTVAAIAAFSFSSVEGGSITGKVTPLDGASKAWAIYGADTLKADVLDGTFNLQGAKPGNYSVIIEAKQPFKKVTINDINVEEGRVTDLGEIKLEQ
ncbi:carboxypeptidase-like regulatory domain-containing protein [Chitinophaga rhizophila]|uniref:Carboxypeptidase-like regulatory domain-containing protein n=1 Tax=Chitinophaga rhizophila TaxID=2866212 RepID=A0ABS7GFN5_9BACT|nr:carboxypeptidase-like regulatory domain-containing protein [Chitinophaga rhizophila]MBW8686502.1 carboxypeptidase-like regulatory domain-containing protein [Chitinophaga rhizophila]